jgi:hypothetical protein
MINLTGPLSSAGLLILAAAKTIAISVTPSTELHNHTLTARVRITNSGDESAHALTPILRFNDKQFRGATVSGLDPNQSTDEVLSLEVGTLTDGRWPFEIAVDYADANHYPFQALHTGLFQVGNPPVGKVVVSEVSPTSVAETGATRIRLKNVSSVVRTSTVVVTGPEGIEISPPRQAITLAPWEERTVSVGVVNRAAIVGSRYPIFVTVSYEDDGVHQATTAQGVVDVLAPESFLQSQRRLLWALAAVILLGWATLVILRAAKRRRRGAVDTP